MPSDLENCRSRQGERRGGVTGEGKKSEVASSHLKGKGTPVGENGEGDVSRCSFSIWNFGESPASRRMLKRKKRRLCHAVGWEEDDVQTRPGTTAGDVALTQRLLCRTQKERNDLHVDWGGGRSFMTETFPPRTAPQRKKLFERGESSISSRQL